jgi:hypothetical protein
MMHLRRALANAAAAVLLAGCGDDATSPASGGGSATTSAVTTGATTAASTGGDGGAGGAGGGGTDLTPAEQAALDEYHAALCDGLARCQLLSFTVLFEDLEDCVARLGELAGGFLFAPGSNETAETLSACAGALAGVDCETFDRAEQLRLQPEECIVPGDRGVGEICAGLNECASYLCSAPLGGCGICLTPGGEGASCAAVPCEPGLLCFAGTCRRYGELDEPCDQGPCVPWLACIDEVCVERIAVGDACDPLVPYWCEADLACNPISSRCEPIGFSEPGAPCGLLDDGTTSACVQGARCRTQEDGGARCVPVVARDEPCDATGHLFGGPCEGVDVCIDGRCTLPEVATCEE